MNNRDKNTKTKGEICRGNLSYYMTERAIVIIQWIWHVIVL